MITPGTGNEPHMDSSQQEEAAFEKDEVENTSYDLSVTEQKARDDT